MNIAMKKPLFILMSILILSSCESGNSNYLGQELADVEREKVAVGYGNPNESMKLSADSYSGRAMATSNFVEQDQTSKIITTADLNMEVASLEKFEASLNELLSKYKANVTNQSRNDSDRRLDAYFTIRVPQDQFNNLFDGLKPFAKKIEHQSLNQQDVTEQFIDVETRLKNRKALEARYLELLKKANNVNDMLNIERQLNQVRSEIESQEGRLKYLNDQVDMSTIQLNAYEVKPYVYEPENQDNFGQRILKSLANGWAGLINGIMWIIGLWPLFLVVGLVVLVVKKRKA
ncbi:uncharacterized protein DUF4349 [Roseivirga ehrenbergii]|uniref:DUF4349 domain-containing protein n=2 Tax=Roseivirga ehrenbergii (strain DSM 102268 / JCM 13514 / KCTC 12282 / NCIMB 14502 / KMM 6017) TaxID=279360 RepID=A0A150WZT2_ROSEK|nr:hypothetical protein MB14_08050 [Roseivirga ehrenbergii]TCL13218.1 uncharacterized protein DUF4349 [Roseivirga ehrenbergii]